LLERTGSMLAHSWLIAGSLLAPIIAYKYTMEFNQTSIDQMIDGHITKTMIDRFLFDTTPNEYNFSELSVTALKAFHLLFKT